MSTTTHIITSALRPEAALLLACARREPDVACIEPLLLQGIDWDELALLARRHGVVPLLYNALQPSLAHLVPPDVLANLRSAYHVGAQQSMALSAELLRLLEQFRQADIPALPLKGPALAMQAYGNLALRCFSDLDILVKPQHVSAARALLEWLGYQLDQPMSPREAMLRLKTHYVYTFVHTNSQNIVELHYRVRPRYFAFALEPSRLWNRAVQVAIGGTTVPSLPADDLLLFLCAHGANHCWERLAWVCDIAELLRTTPDSAWPALITRAQAEGSARLLRLGLLLAHELCAAPMPPAVLGWVRADAVAGALAHQSAMLILDAEDMTPGLATSTLFHLRARERWRDRLRYCLGVATVSSAEDWALLPLPAPLAWAYSLIRPFRLAKAYGAAALRELWN